MGFEWFRWGSPLPGSIARGVAPLAANPAIYTLKKNYEDIKKSKCMIWRNITQKPRERDRPLATGAS
jgi:hypothetical protein